MKEVFEGAMRNPVVSSEYGWIKQSAKCETELLWSKIPKYQCEYDAVKLYVSTTQTVCVNNGSEEV